MQPDQRDAILQYLSDNIGTLSLSLPQNDQQQTLDMLAQWLEVDPSFFFAQCGPTLPGHMRAYFTQPHQDMQRRTIHNRRYNYLVHHLRPDGYFDENDVRLREPVLFEEHIGQFMTPEERAAPYPDDMTLMDRIFHGIDRRYVQDQWDREKQRQRQQLPEEESDDDDAGKDGGENDVVMTDVQSSSSKNLSINKRAAQQDENDGDDSDQEEDETDLSGVDLAQRERWNELTQLLEERWLDGLDINFDYAQVDDNPDYDDLRQLNQDMQDDYFDTEEAVGPSHDTGMQDF